MRFSNLEYYARHARALALVHRSLLARGRARLPSLFAAWAYAARRDGVVRVIVWRTIYLPQYHAWNRRWLARDRARLAQGCLVRWWSFVVRRRWGWPLPLEWSH